MINDLHVSANYLEKAKVPEDVFGALIGTVEEKIHEIAVQYRKITQLIHPDKFTGPDAERANACFVKLKEWKRLAETKVTEGTYGDRKSVVEVKPPPVIDQTIKAPNGTYNVFHLLTQGDLADIYRCKFNIESRTQYAIFKIAQSPGDNDLLKVEADTLKALYPKEQTSEKFYRYLPKLYDTFLLKGKSGTHRQANVLQYADDHVSFSDILKAYPKGIDFRDVVWMFKRMLAALGFVHSKGIIHGAVIPPHILVHPKEHGAKLVDWCYATSSQDKTGLSGRVRAISKAHKDFYAPEILRKERVTAQTDIYMAAKCAVYLLCGDVVKNKIPTAVPTKINDFLQSCLFSAQNKRPDDAWALHEEFDELLKRVVGRQAYRPLAMPTKKEEDNGR